MVVHHQSFLSPWYRETRYQPETKWKGFCLLNDAIYGSSVGFRGDALVELEGLSKSRNNDPENKLDFKTANFENNIYSVTKC